MSSQRDPFGTELSTPLRVAVSAGMGAAGVVFGAGGASLLGLGWLSAVCFGLPIAALLAFVAWRSPELFFKNRP